MAKDRAPVASPPRGTRPPNRRALIITAATELFYREGYDQVAMADIAGRVGVGPSALYRHFPGKQELLREVIAVEMAPVARLLGNLDTTDRAGALAALASIALDHRTFSVLWQREARHLPEGDRDELRRGVRGIGHRLASLLASSRPGLPAAGCDLLARSMLAVLTSPSFHQIDLPRPRYEEVLAALAGRVLEAQVPAAFAAAPPRPPRPGLAPRSRREALLSQAARMFAERSFASVSVDDVAAALGIAGQSVYNHFPSKLDMLLTVLSRGAAHLQMLLAGALAEADDAADALARLADSYCGFAIVHHHIVDLLVGEVRSLPEPHRQAMLAAQREHIDEWVHLLRQVHPALDPAVARIEVQAALSLVNDVARTAHLRRAANVRPAVAQLCGQLLDLRADRR